NLAPHPEGGYFRETFRAPLEVSTTKGPRAAHTAIYFLLPSGAFSAFHRVSSDEVWHYYDGDPLDLHLIDEAGTYSCVRLGRDIARGEVPQHVVPAGVWQAAAPHGELHTLCGCTVAPGFDFRDFEMPPRETLLAQVPMCADIIRSMTR